MARPEVTPQQAREVLEVAADAGSDQVRAAYRRLLLRTHPDLSTAEDATTRTVALTAAYRVLLAETEQHREQPPETSATTERDQGASAAAADDTRTSTIALVDRDTIGVAAPPAETLLMVIDAAHRLGEVSYLDPAAGLLEVVVEFQGAPTSSLVLSLQGRATGITEVFCTVEPLSGGASPPVDAVVRLVLRTLQGEDPST